MMEGSILSTIIQKGKAPWMHIVAIQVQRTTAEAYNL